MTDLGTESKLFHGWKLVAALSVILFFGMGGSVYVFPVFIVSFQAEFGWNMTQISAGAALFAIGMVGFLSRRNLIVMFLSTEIMFQGVVVNLVAFGRLHAHLDGQAFALFILVIAAVEAGLGLGLVVLLFRRKSTLDAEAWAAMRG